jgi:hypothetical protein
MRKHNALIKPSSVIALISAAAASSANAEIIFYDSTYSTTLNTQGEWWYLDGGSTGTIALGSLCTTCAPSTMSFPSNVANGFRLADSG